MSKKIKITKEQENLLKSSIHKVGSLRELGRILKVGNQTVSRWCDALGLDISNLKNRNTIKDKNLIGKKIGCLTLKKVVWKDGDPKHRKYWLCQCDCGNLCEKRADGIYANRFISCGCHAKNRYNMVADKNPAFKGYKKIRMVHFNEIKRSANKRGIEFSVSIKYLWELYSNQDCKCALTGLPIVFGRLSHRHETSASLDRIDSKYGYIKGNLQWVLKDINLLKSNYDNEYFIKLCNHVAHTHPRDVN